MASMLDSARELVTPGLLSRLSAQTGESEGALSKGMGVVIAILFAWMAHRSEDRAFMSQAASVATDTANDPNALTRLPHAVGGAPDVDATAPFGGWLSRLFDGHLSDVTDGVARHANISRGTSSSLLLLGAPLVLGYLGRLMRSEGLNADGLADRLRRDRRAFAAAVPMGLEAFLPGITREPVETARVAGPDFRHRAEEARIASAPDRSHSGWVLPLVLVAVAIGGLLWWHGTQRRAADMRASTEVTRPIGTSGRATAPAPMLPAPSVPAATKPTAWSESESIQFRNGASSFTPASKMEIDKIAETLKAHPDARVDIEGYTDNVGRESSNVALSHARAAAVMNALKGMGVSIDRMTIEGHGSQGPIASNTTADGRAQNRRVQVEMSTH